MYQLILRHVLITETVYVNQMKNNTTCKGFDLMGDERLKISHGNRGQIRRTSKTASQDI
jgi:hypothetical protein